MLPKFDCFIIAVALFLFLSPAPLCRISGLLNETDTQSSKKTRASTVGGDRENWAIPYQKSFKGVPISLGTTEIVIGKSSKFTLLTFVRPNCNACKQELKGVKNFANTPIGGRNLDIILASDEELQQSEFPVATNSSKLWQIFRRGQLVPSTVLLSPAGDAVLSTDGYQGGNSGSILSDALFAYFSGTPSDTLPLTQWLQFPTSIDKLSFELGKKINTLSNDKVVTVTFLPENNFSNLTRYKRIQQLGVGQQVRHLFVINTASSKLVSSEASRNVLVYFDDKQIMKNLNITTHPATYVYYKGRSVVMEIPTPLSNSSFFQVIQYCMFLSETKNLNSGFTGQENR
jgi:thioredoxin-related protein